MADGIEKRWAFLVGINRYDDPSYGDLEFCVDDVKALSRLLEQDLGYEKVVCIHDDPAEDRYKPTAAGIGRELKLLCDLAGPNDLMLVHFACHGLRLDNEPYLITSDTAAHNPKRYALSVADVEQMMRDSGARCKVLLLDACHTGVEMGRDLADPEFLRHVYEEAEGFAVIAASTAQQRAYEFGGNGLFTHHLLQALSGKADSGKKGFVSVKDVEGYVLHHIKSWNQETAMVQTPTSQVEGFGDMVLAYYPDEVSTELGTSLSTTPPDLRARSNESSTATTQPVMPFILAPKQIQLLQEALLNAFPRGTDLEMLVQFHLDRDLNQISMAEPLTARVFHLLRWVNAQNRVHDLLNGALEMNPNNPKLLSFVRSL